MFLLRRRMPATSSPICGYIMGSPPQMETMGAPHSSTAARHSSSGTRSLIVDSYSRIRPHPVHVRLQACRGSSIITRGKRLRIMGCGWRLARSTGTECRMRNGFAPFSTGVTSFCHSGRGRILFLKMYLAMPAVSDRGNFIFSSVFLGAQPLHVSRERQQREIQPVIVVVQIENFGEPRAGRQLFFPAPVGPLGFEQIGDAVLHAQAVSVAAGNQAHQRPGGL